LVTNGLKGKVTVMATGSWIRDKLLNKPNTKINLVFKTNVKEIDSFLLTSMIRDYEILRNDITFSDTLVSKVEKKPSCKLNPMDIGVLNLKGQELKIT
jgi:hypothetical protein